MSKKTDYWTEYEKQVAEWFASGDCNYFHKTLDKAKLNTKSNEIYETLRNKENH